MSQTHPPRIAIYPGSFDPLTSGHVDIIERGARIFDSIIVAILANVEKKPLFTESERVSIIRDVFKGTTNVQVETFDGLLVDYAQRKKASVLVRGLRAVSDFEYEFQMAGMNARLNPGVETIFLMASDRHQFISSRLVKEIGVLGGNVGPFVPARVAKRLLARVAERGGGWIDYEVVNPVNDVVEAKTSYILPLGEDTLIGCGVFKPKGGFKLQPL